MPYALIDRTPLWLLAIVGILLLGAANQLGRLLGKRRPQLDRDHHAPYAGMIVGALLALLALLLAFAFGAVESRFLERKQLALDEANAVGTTFLRAGFLDEEHKHAVRATLREYADIKAPRSPAEIASVRARSDALQLRLWREAEGAGAERPRSVVASLFVSSLNHMLDLREERVTITIYQRLPVVVLAILTLVALLSVGALGYTGGLARSRARFPAVATILSVAFVMSLIVELDRPLARLIHVSDHAMRDVRAMMDAYDDGVPGSRSQLDGEPTPKSHER